LQPPIYAQKLFQIKLLKLSVFQPKIIDAYTRGLRIIGNYFDCKIKELSSDQLLEYFHNLLEELFWSTVKLDLYGLRVFYAMVFINQASQDIKIKLGTDKNFAFAFNNLH